MHKDAPPQDTGEANKKVEGTKKKTQQKSMEKEKLNKDNNAVFNLSRDL